MARRRWSFFMGPLEHGGLRRLDDLVRGRLTPAGRWLSALLMGTAALLPGAASPAMLWLCSGTAALLLASTAAGLLARQGTRLRAGTSSTGPLQLTRHLPLRVAAGATCDYAVSVTNSGTTTLTDLRLEERALPAALRPVGEPPRIDRIGPGETVRVTLQLRPTARGAHRLERLQLSSDAPSGLIKWGAAQRARQELLVGPPRVAPALLAPVLAVLRRPAVAGRAGALSTGTRAIAADRDQWTGLRPFVSGDRLTDLHARASARAGQPLVRVWASPPIDERFVVLVAPSRIDLRSRRWWEAAAAVASALLDAPEAVRLVVARAGGVAVLRGEEAQRFLAESEPESEVESAVDSLSRDEAALRHWAASRDAGDAAVLWLSQQRPSDAQRSARAVVWVSVDAAPLTLWQRATGGESQAQGPCAVRVAT